MKSFLAFVGLISMIWFQVKSQAVYTIGPTVHYSFNKTFHRFSYGVEAATWDFKNMSIFGFDLGIEFYNAGFRVYSELETGAVLFGGSVGPVIEHNFNENTKVGFQVGLWTNYYLGFDYKRRYFENDKENYSTGSYFKFMFPKDWPKDLGSELISGALKN